jgi:hypothetical protein
VNIFAVDSDPIKSAQALVDSHVVKMVLESAQLLSTAHRVLDGENVPDVLYKATHKNHPSAIWCRASNNNYNWLYCHFLALLSEYTHRYGKHHKCEGMVEILKSPPLNIPVGYKTQVTPAMPEEYIVPGNSVASYRNYYREGKKHLHKWTKRQPPEWMNDRLQENP